MCSIHFQFFLIFFDLLVLHLIIKNEVPSTGSWWCKHCIWFSGDASNYGRPSSHGRITTTSSVKQVPLPNYDELKVSSVSVSAGFIGLTAVNDHCSWVDFKLTSSNNWTGLHSGNVSDIREVHGSNLFRSTERFLCYCKPCRGYTSCSTLQHVTSPASRICLCHKDTFHKGNILIMWYISFL